MHCRRFPVAVVVIALLATGRADSQSTPPLESDLLIRWGGPVDVGAGEEAWNVAVINHNVTVDGRIRSGVMVINGDAAVSGSVDGTVICVNGAVRLGPAARVGQDVVLFRCQLDRQAGAVVGGSTLQETGLSFGRRAFLFLWTGTTIVALVGALAFAALGGNLLGRMTAILTQTPGQAAAFGLMTWITFPIVAALAFLTVVAAPLGLTILFGLAPAVGFLGYLGAATALGEAIRRVMNLPNPGGRPYRAAIIGALVAQIVGLVPVVGGVAILLAGALGGGALASLGWYQWHRAGPPGPATNWAEPN